MDDIELINDPDEIVLNRNRNVNEFLGNPPGSILSFGPTLVLSLLFFLFLLAWLIKYPDIIPAKITIVTENPAIRVISRTSGKLDLLLVKNDEVVLKGQELAVLDNTADWNDIKTFELFLNELRGINSPLDYIKVNAPSNLSLGTIQYSYATLLQKLKDYSHFLKQQGVFTKIHSLEIQIEHIRALNKEIIIQQQTLEKEVEIAKKNYNRNLLLYNQGAISSIDLEGAETHYLQYKRQYENIRSQYISNTIRMEELNAEISDLGQNRIDGQNDRELVLEEHINRIRSEIHSWKQGYLIVAPIGGKVSLSKIWSEQQFVEVNQEVLAIVPIHGKGKIIGKAILPIINSGKVKTGQSANILLDGFPYQEFGVIPANVGRISLISQEDNYLLELQLPDSLITTYKKVIPFRQEMSGTANIIVEDRRIIERIFDKFWSIIKNS